MRKPLHLPGMTPPELIVNVASIQQRSPFRYPGGKTWLVPRIRQWLAAIPPARRKTFVEPFAGGAIVGLSVAFDGLAERVVLVELDAQVAAVWETIINAGEGEWLAGRVLNFDLTPASVAALLAAEGLAGRDLAFQTLVKNRVNRGGILAPGAGKLNCGEKGKGIASRWYPETLARRIRDIDHIRDRLSFIHGDGLDVLQQYTRRDDAVYFIDPPYTAAGKKPGSRLYTHANLDHEALFETAARLAGDFVMTYHDVEEVRRLAYRYNLTWRVVAMKNTHHASQTELLIGRDLGWVE